MTEPSTLQLTRPHRPVWWRLRRRPDGAPVPGTELAGDVSRVLRKPPRVVVLATLLFALVTALWTVAVPAYRAPDEVAHFDLVLYLAEGNGYPGYDDRFFGEAIELDTRRYLVDSSVAWPLFDASEAPTRRDRPDAADLGGTAPDDDVRPADPSGRPDHPYLYNQMPQHPPLYYLGMASVLGIERLVLPGDDLPSLDRELGLLRLANVMLVAPLPLLAWGTVMQLTDGAGRRAGIVASLLPLSIPQLTFIGGSLNNDNLLLLLGGTMCLLLTGVARGRRTRRIDVAVGLLLGLALLTKGFAFMFVPWVAAAYALGAWTARRQGDSDDAPPSTRDWALGGVVATGVAAVVGGWWWFANWVRFGEPAPTTESLTRNPDGSRGVADPDRVWFIQQFVERLVERTWSWIGYRTPKLGEFDGRMVVLLTLAAAVAVGVAAWSAATGTRTGPWPRRGDVVLAWLPVLLLVVFVARRAWSLHLETGALAFIQGRYLFAGFVGPMAVVAIGASRALRRAAVVTALSLGCVLQTWVLTDVVRGAWSGDGRLGALDGLLAWSPWPSAMVVATGLAAVGVAAAIAVQSVRRQPTV